MCDNAGLLKSYRMGDDGAYDKLIENNLGLVHCVVKKFSATNYEYDDLFQVGAIGLIKAVKKFDDSFGVKFSTYAVPMILGEIKRFMRDDGIMKVSRSIRENALKGRRAEERLRQAIGRAPTIKEIAKEARLTEDELIEAYEASVPPESLQSVIGGDPNGAQLAEFVAGDEPEERIVDKLTVDRLLSCLDSRSYRIMVLRYFRHKTQSEIAREIGVSQVQISRIEKKALETMKKQLENTYFF